MHLCINIVKTIYLVYSMNMVQIWLAIEQALFDWLKCIKLINYLVKKQIIFIDQNIYI